MPIISKRMDYFHTDDLKDNLKNRAIKGATVSIITQCISFVIQTIGTIIIARLLTPDDFGLVTMVLTVGLFLSNLGPSGITEAIIQAKEINNKQISTLFWVNVIFGALLMVVFTASSSIIISFYKEPRIKNIIYLFSISIILSCLSVQHLALLKRKMEYTNLSINDLIATFTSNVVAIILAFWGFGYWSLVAKWLIGPFVLTVGAWMLCEWRPGFPSRDAGIGPMLNFGLHTLGNSIMNYFRKNLDKVLIGRLYGSNPLGFYDRAYHLSGILPNQLLMPMYGVAVSTFSRLAEEPEKYRMNFLSVLSILAFVSMPLSAILSLCSQDLVLLLLGPKWVNTGNIFLAFSLSIGVAVIYTAHGWLHLSLGTPSKWFRWGIVEFIVFAICIIIGVRYGALGVAIAYSLSYYLMLAPAFWYAGSKIDLTITSVICSLWKYYSSAVLSGICCWLLLYKYDMISGKFINLDVISRIAVSTVLCTSFYLCFIVCLHRGFKPIYKFSSVMSEMFQKQERKNQKSFTLQ